MSWYLNETGEGYDLFFNRDEQKARSRASLPAMYKTESGTAYVAPIDNDAGGTWIAVNEFGITICLLNHYQFQQIETYKNWRSRGEIVRILAETANIREVKSRFKSIDLSDYRAFRLFAIDRSGNNRLCVWDGRTLSIELTTTSPQASSAVDAKNVKQVRGQFYADSGLAKSTNKTDFYRYHASHHPEPSQSSVCMHREEAETVSFTHINVKDNCAQVYYSDGSPCSNSVKLITSLDLHKEIQYRLKPVSASH